MMGTRQERYAEQFATLFAAKKAFAFWKGRVALYAILRALGLREGDEVIMPGYTCAMAVSPVKYLGARPIYIDIEPETFNMDVSRVEARITARTKLIIAQHTYGYLVDMDPLLEIANRHGIPVVEDCCLALGSRYKGRLAGTFGVAAYFSSQWNKLYTTGLGGIAVCHDEQLADRMGHLCGAELQPVPWHTAALLMMQLATYRTVFSPATAAYVRRLFRWLVYKGVLVGSTSPVEKKKLAMPADFFMGMSLMQASSGLRQLQKLDGNIEHRRRMAALCETLLIQHGWPARKVPRQTDPVLVRYPLRVANKWELIERAEAEGIELGAWFEAPLHPRETPHELYEYRWGMCPEAERASREVVNLPVHPRVSETIVRRTVAYVSRGRLT
jgi:dTDP-4-amino-4,6-dideoxygalactose transaminase